MRLLLIADTHLPQRAKRLPDQVWREVETADVVIHAGDWVEVALLDELEARSKRLIGVYGNNDGADLRARLPEIARADLGGVRLAVIHETGGKQGREPAATTSSRTPTSSCSGTATSPGTRSRRRGCGC